MSSNKIIKSSIVVMIFVIIGKVLALIRDALVASRFGLSSSTDIYMFSIGLVYLITSVSYGLTTTFIPVQSDHIENYERDRNNRFVNNVLNVSMLATAVITVLCIIFAKYIIIWFAPGFTKHAVVFKTSVDVTRVMIISLFFVTAQSVLAGVLQAHKQFYAPAAMATCSNIVYIVYLAFFAKQYGIYGFAWATVLGFFVQYAINVPQYKMLGYKYRLYINFKDKELRRMLLFMIPVVISTSTVQLNIFVNRYFATLLGSGYVSSLDFSNKLNTIVGEVFANTISTVIFATLASLAAKNNYEEFNRTFIKAMNVILMVMIPASVATAVLRVPVITLVFMRGKFNASAVSLTASALLFYCPNMVANGVREILNKSFYSVKDTNTPMINGIIGILINILISAALYKSMKVSGLSLASSISGIVTTVFLVSQLKRKVKKLDTRKILGPLVKMTISSAIMGGILYLINLVLVRFLGSGTKASAAILLVSLVIGSIVYFVCVKLMKVEEYQYIAELARKKFSKAK